MRNSRKWGMRLPKAGAVALQESFFFCWVQNMGDVPGAGNIYVETVVDRDSGVAFAKVYPAKNAMNAVDILASRVLPFFGQRGLRSKEIHTHKKNEYCGLNSQTPVRNFPRHISHSNTCRSNRPGQPYIYLCDQFYRFLEKECFQPELRTKFNFHWKNSKSLDSSFKPTIHRNGNTQAKSRTITPPSSKFPVDL